MTRIDPTRIQKFAIARSRSSQEPVDRNQAIEELKIRIAEHNKKVSQFIGSPLVSSGDFDWVTDLNNAAEKLKQEAEGLNIEIKSVPKRLGT